MHAHARAHTRVHTHTRAHTHTHTQLMHVNNQWDIEYREQEEAFRRYRYDSQQAQTENHALIAKLKREKEESAEEIKTLNFELQRLNRELESLRQRLDSVEPQQGRVAAPSYAGGRGGVGVGVSLQRVAALEEEIALLRQQVSQSDCIKDCKKTEFY